MKATKEQIVAEANRRAVAQGYGAQPVEHFIVDVVCENWTPPEPVVDPDLLAMRKLLAAAAPELADAYLRGDFDNRMVWAVEVYKAAREQEQERAKGLVDRLSDLVERVTHDGKRDYVTGVNAGEMISARVVLAKYRGEA